MQQIRFNGVADAGNLKTKELNYRPKILHIPNLFLLSLMLFDDGAL